MLNYVLFLTPMIFIILGILIKYFKQYWLIAGYNTSTREEKERVDKEKLGSFMGNMLFLLAAINLGGYILNYLGYKLLGDLTWGLFLIVIFVIVVKGQSFYKNPIDKRANRTNIIIVLVVSLPILVFVFGLIGYGSKTNEVIIEGEQVRIVGFYGTSVAREAITSIDLVAEIPKVERKVNGFNFANIEKGVFRLNQWGDGYLFLESNKGPYIVIRYNELGFIIINYKNSDNTANLYSILSEFNEGKNNN